MNSIWNIFGQFPTRHKAITPSDTVNLSQPMLIYCTVAGNVVIVDKNDVALTYAATVGWISPVVAKRVNATSTTATVIGLFN